MRCTAGSERSMPRASASAIISAVGLLKSSCAAALCALRSASLRFASRSASRSAPAFSWSSSRSKRSASISICRTCCSNGILASSRSIAATAPSGAPDAASVSSAASAARRCSSSLL